MSMARITDFLGLAERVIDLSADFRLRNATDYSVWYGHEHSNPSYLQQAVWYSREHHEAIRNASVTGPAVWPPPQF
jgi:N-acetyl-gamma-glutamylphosphate reductase